VLEAWDRLNLKPRNRDGRYEVEPSPASPARRSGDRQRRPPAGVLPLRTVPSNKLPSQPTLFPSPLESSINEVSEDELR
jgi:hypothetical protein